MMDETQARKVLADATAPPMPGPGQLVDPPEVARYAQRGEPPISEWPGRAVTRKDLMIANGDPRDWFRYGHRNVAFEEAWEEFADGPQPPAGLDHPAHSTPERDITDADDAVDNGTVRVLKAPDSSSRRPTPLQTARWNAVQKAKRRGLSIRGGAREVGILRDTANKYMEAVSPPMKLDRINDPGSDMPK